VVMVYVRRDDYNKGVAWLGLYIVAWPCMCLGSDVTVTLETQVRGTE